MYEILLCLFANNFFNLANYIALFLLFYTIWKKGFHIIKIKASVFYILFLGSVFYFTIYSFHFGIPKVSTVFLRFVNPVILFYIGFLRGKDGFDLFMRDIIFMGLGGFLHGIMNVVKNKSVNVLLIEGRQYLDIYGGSISATLQNLMFVITSGMLIYFLTCEKRITIKYIGIIMSFGGVYSSVMNASRTLIYVTIISFFAALFIYIYYKNGSMIAIFRFILTVLFIFLIVALFSFFDLFHFKELIVNTALGQRVLNMSAYKSITDNLRWSYAKDILRLLPIYIMGNIPYEHYAHNLWIDIAKEAGIIPFLLYIAFTLGVILATLRFATNKSHGFKEKTFIIPIMLSFILVFFTEPIMIGSPITFSLFCFIAGGVVSISYKDRYLKT